MTEILNAYVKTAPSPQNALDIFVGEWASQLPGDFSSLAAGKALLFEDARVVWAAEQFKGFRNKSVLELGPLEAGHTYMMEKLEAKSVTSIEANTRAYLKCLIIKELLELKRSRFLCGDFVEYLKASSEKFDICFASGVLYHMQNPVELISLLAKASQQIFIWTHYYDLQLIQQKPHLIAKFPESIVTQYQGFSHTLYKYEYQSALDFSGFCGGNAPFSAWMSRDELIACLQYFGFKEIQVGFDHPDHPNGPSFAIAATR